jgi:hypothetical protein
MIRINKTIVYCCFCSGRQDDTNSLEVRSNILSDLCKHASLFLHASPTWIFGCPIGNLKYLQMYGYKLMTSTYWMNSFSLALYWRRIASVRPPYSASRVCRGIYSTIGCVSSSSFWFTIAALSNSHLHWILTCYTACVICSNRDIMRSYLSARVSPPMLLTSRERLTGMPVIKTSKVLVDYFRIGAVSVYAIICEFGGLYSRPLLACFIWQTSISSICSNHIKAFFL